MKNDALTIDDLHHKYDKRENSNWILNEINLKIETGELLGLLGPSGCGKTTLLRLIAGFEYPSKGSISLNDKEISSSNRILSPEKRNIGMVFQDYALFPHLTVLENVMFGVKNKSKRSKVDYLIDIVGLDKLTNRYPHELSGGQKQRVCVARAIALNPSLLILDEPTSALDVSVQAQVLNLIKDLQEVFNFTLVMVTHDLPVVSYMCDELIVMKNGKIVEAGKTDSVVGSPSQEYTKKLINSII